MSSSHQKGFESPRSNGGRQQRFDSSSSTTTMTMTGNATTSPRQQHLKLHQSSSQQQVRPLDLGPLEPFLKPEFDVTAYTKEALVGPDSAESSLRSLKSHLETVEHAISSHVVTHEDSLLGTLEAVGSLKREMSRGKADSTALLVSLTRVENDFNEPLERLKSIGVSLRNAHDATGILRRLGWFLVARKKLKAALEEQKQVGATGAGKEASKAAQLVAELEELLNEGGLKGVGIVDAESRWIKEVGTKVRLDAQKALEKAIVSLNQGEMGLALQAFFHLKILEDRVSVATIWAAKEFSQEARDALKDVNSGGSGNSDSSQRVQALRTRTDTMLERSLRTWALRIWNLQRVLTKKRDPTTHVLFSDVVKIDAFDQFWHRATVALEQELKTCSRWVREALVDDYARLRRSARAMLRRLWTSTSSVGMSTGPSTGGKKLAVGGPKETQALMQAFHPFLSEFLARSLSRLNQPVNVMFPEEEIRGLRHVDPRPKSIPTTSDVTTFAQIIGRELLAVKGDPELLGAIAKACGVAVSLFCEKSEALVSKADAAHTFRLVPPEFSFSTSSASAVPITSTARTGAQEHNVTILTLASLLSAKIKEIMDVLMMSLATESQAASGMNAANAGDDLPTISNGEDLEDDEEEDRDNFRSGVADQDQGVDADDQVDPAQSVHEQNDFSAKSPQPLPPSTTQMNAGITAKLESARHQLDQLILDILEDYVTGDHCFRALDDILNDLNAENYNVMTDSNTSAIRNFAQRFARACKTLKEEHLSKLPANDAVCQESIAKLCQRVARRVIFRAACVRPLSEAGRGMLVRDLQSVCESILAINTAHGGALNEDKILSDMNGFEKLLAMQVPLNLLVQQGSVRKVIAWHHLFSTAPSEVHSPHTKANKTIAQYVNEIDTPAMSDDKVWQFVAACIQGKDETIRRPFVELM